MDGLLGVAGMIITSDEMDHSHPFSTFSTSMSIYPSKNWGWFIIPLIFYGAIYLVNPM